MRILAPCGRNDDAGMRASDPAREVVKPRQLETDRRNTPIRVKAWEDWKAACRDNLPITLPRLLAKTFLDLETLPPPRPLQLPPKSADERFSPLKK